MIPKESCRRERLTTNDETMVEKSLKNLYDEVSRCNRCGFCLERCPVYRTVGREAGVARGRNSIIRFMIEGKSELGEAVEDNLFDCLLCGACLTDCPSKVETPRNVALARASYREKMGLPRMLKFIFRRVLQDEKLAVRLLGTARPLQKSGISKLSALLLPFSSLGEKMYRLQGMARLPGEFLRASLPRDGVAEDSDTAYFVGCGINYALPEVGRASVRLLNRVGIKPAVMDNVCCGLPAFGYGDLEGARQMARKNLDHWREKRYKHIVTDCGSCYSFLSDWPRLFDEGDPYRADAEQFAGSLREVSRFLVERGVKVPRVLEHTVSYHDPCHLSREHKVCEEPRFLLRAAAGERFYELPEADWCCGGAGTYNISHPRLSDGVLARKMRNFSSTGAEILATSCPGCILQLRRGVARGGGQVKHVVEVLDEVIG